MNSWRHILFSGAALVAAAPAHAADFLKAIDDVPLMPGFAEESEPLIFESDQGRVIRTHALGQAGGSRISDFYLSTLPALGWKRQDGDTLTFERESERLTIQIREPASSLPVEVRFELVVKLASTKLPE